jgi:hypothetical protein
MRHHKDKLKIPSVDPILVEFHRRQHLVFQQKLNLVVSKQRIEESLEYSVSSPYG